VALSRSLIRATYSAHPQLEDRKAAAAEVRHESVSYRRLEFSLE
jgi:hypothetical protein